MIAIYRAARYCDEWAAFCCVAALEPQFPLRRGIQMFHRLMSRPDADAQQMIRIIEQMRAGGIHSANLGQFPQAEIDLAREMVAKIKQLVELDEASEA